MSFVTGLWTTLLGNWKLYLAGAALGAGVFGAGFYMGTDYMKGKNASAALTATVEKVEKKDENQGIADTSGVAVGAAVQGTRKSAGIIKKKAIEYIKSPVVEIIADTDRTVTEVKTVDRKAPFDDMWICLHNQAATGNEDLIDDTCPKGNKK